MSSSSSSSSSSDEPDDDTKQTPPRRSTPCPTKPSPLTTHVVKYNAKFADADYTHITSAPHTRDALSAMTKLCARERAKSRAERSVTTGDDATFCTLLKLLSLLRVFSFKDAEPLQVTDRTRRGIVLSKSLRKVHSPWGTHTINLKDPMTIDRIPAAYGLKMKPLANVHHGYAVSSLDGTRLTTNTGFPIVNDMWLAPMERLVLADWWERGDALKRWFDMISHECDYYYES